MSCLVKSSPGYELTRQLITKMVRLRVVFFWLQVVLLRVVLVTKCPDTRKSASCKTLQLPIDNIEENDRPHFIVYMVDLTCRESLKIVENSLQCVDGKQYAGKTCIVALKVKCPERRAFDLDALTNLAHRHYCEVYYGSLETEMEKDVLAKQIIRVSEVACGQKHNVTPLLVESTKWFSEQYFL
ncbi:hypothetical protein FSP39_012280 [Pinctada imbricata]|uniref:Centromere protein M n=1 Tax=Pinctada imbricata TaxID=66713 RepID=A0AA89C1J1_PINIB|nr:hypothetical protein FSP39_012280 [Pinctada imbricata]